MRHEAIDQVQQLLRGTPSEYDGDITHRDAPLIQSSQRWLATLGFFLSASSFGFLMSSTWLTSDYVAKVSSFQRLQLYGVDRIWLDMYTVSFLVSPLLLCLVASATISVDSLTTSLTLGILMSAIGAWLRSFIDDNFVLAFCGQCLASLGVSFFLAAPSFISARWFFPSNRGTATLIMTLSPMIFAFAGPALATQIISQQASASLTAHYRHRLLIYFKFEAIYATLSGCVGMLLFQEAPSSPPAHSQTVQRISFTRSLKLLVSHYSFLRAIIASALSIAIYISFNFFSASILLKRDMPRQSLGFFYLIYIPVAIAAVLFCAFLYRLLQKTKALLLIAKIALLITLLAAVAFVDRADPLLLLVLLILQTAFFAPILGLTLELISDITFPIGQAISAGFLLGTISLFSVILCFVQHFCSNRVELFFLLLVLLQALALLLMIFVREEKNPRKLADSDDFILFKNNEADISQEEDTHALPL